MKHISVLIPEGDTSLSNIEATYKMFNRVNDALLQSGMHVMFRLQLVGIRKEAHLSNGLFTIKPDCVIGDIKKTDLIIIPAVHGNIDKVLADNQPFLPWIISQYSKGAEVVSLCIGAFILAATGLLNGRSCTTHWLAADDFRKMFPEVNLMPYKILTDEGGIYSSGGAYSSLNLILYLVEKFAGRDMALISSKVFEIDINRNSQSPFTIFSGQKDHEDQVVHNAQVFIEENFNSKITVEQLASSLALSRRNLERRFKKATSNTIIEYIQRVKIEAAKKSLESSNENVNEVMYNVGYTDSKAFREAFKKITGISPVQYRSRYNRDIQYQQAYS